MATQSAVFTFALPEDINSDQIRIFSSATKEGTYSLATSVDYEYGTTSYEYDTLDDVLWYKIIFNNSVDSEVGPWSDPVYGGDFSKASPFLAISTASDGANYATNQDVYDYATLTTADVTQARVSQALRRARSIVDLKTAALNLSRFTRTFDTDTSRKKYNATLRIVREAEINIALGNIYRGISDDLVMNDLREVLAGNDTSSEGVAIGATSISSSSGLANPQHMSMLRQLANRYLSIGTAMLAALMPPSIRLHHEPDEFVRSPRFTYPFNGFS